MCFWGTDMISTSCCFREVNFKLRTNSNVIKNNFTISNETKKPTPTTQLEYWFLSICILGLKNPKNPFALSILKYRVVTSQRSHQSQKQDHTSWVHSEQLWKNKLGQCPFLWYPNLKINQNKLWVRKEKCSSYGQINTKNEIFMLFPLFLQSNWFSLKSKQDILIVTFLKLLA